MCLLFISLENRMLNLISTIIFPNQMAPFSDTDLTPVLFRHCFTSHFSATHPLKTKRVSQEASAAAPRWPYRPDATEGQTRPLPKVCIFFIIVHLCIHVYIYIYMHTVHIYTYIYICMCIYIYACVNIYIYIYTLYIYVYMYTYIYIYIYIIIHTVYFLIYIYIYYIHNFYYTIIFIIHMYISYVCVYI